MRHSQKNGTRHHFLLFWLPKHCFVTIQPMQSFNTKTPESGKPAETPRTLTVGRAADVLPGQCVTVNLSNGRELALYNVDGDFYATSNCCPHKGAPLSEGDLRGHLIECNWHGWQFDVRTGVCLTTGGNVEVYRVFVEEGWLKIEI